MEIRVIATVNSQYQITAAFLVFGCVLFLRVSEPPRVSRRPNFLREYPNEKYLLT